MRDASTVICLWLTLVSALPAQGEVVHQEINGLRVSASLVLAEEAAPQGPVFLILHGTWAHAGMEIIEGLQTGLAERGFSSLAPTLSLGESDRSGFRDCAPPFHMRHEDAVEELGVWVQYLKGRGYGELVLVGHSRGAAQVDQAI